jgi:hypothetical protein
MEHKRCSGCGEIKSINEFYKKLSSWASRCKTCTKEYHQRPEVKEKRRKRQREAYHRNPEYYKEKAARLSTPEKIEQRRAKQRDYNKRPEVKSRKRKYRKKYYQENRDAILEWNRQYYHEHKEERAFYSKQWRNSNRDYIRQHQKQYSRRPENVERIKQYQEGYRSCPKRKAKRREYERQYRTRPHAKEQDQIQQRIIHANRKAQLSKLPNTLTEGQWQYALNYFNGGCAVCGSQLNDLSGKRTIAADHWIPLSYKGDDNPGTVATNIVPLCHGVDGCNNSKNNTMPDVWLEWKFGKRKAKKIMKRIQDYFDSLEDL